MAQRSQYIIAVQIDASPRQDPHAGPLGFLSAPISHLPPLLSDPTSSLLPYQYSIVCASLTTLGCQSSISVGAFTNGSFGKESMEDRFKDGCTRDVFCAGVSRILLDQIHAASPTSTREIHLGSRGGDLTSTNVGMEFTCVLG